MDTATGEREAADPDEGKNPAPCAGPAGREDGWESPGGEDDPGGTVEEREARCEDARAVRPLVA